MATLRSMTIDAGVVSHYDPQELADLDAAHLWHPWSPAQLPGDHLMLVAGEGCDVIDISGRRFLDARSGMFNATLGYARLDVVAAMQAQASALMTYSLGVASTPPPVYLAARLAELLGEPLTRTFFVHSGSEATETAVKLARMYHALRGEPSRRTVLSLADGYHGTTLGPAAMSGLPSVRTGCEPLPAGFVTIPTPACRPCLDGLIHGQCHIPGPGAVREAIERLGARSVAAFMVEPVLGVGGVVPLPMGYLTAAREICDQYGMLLIVDEVMTGVGRTGSWFAHQHAGVRPDVVTAAKGLTAGYAPLASVTTTQDIFEVFGRDPLLHGFRHGHTTSGHAVAAAAGLAVLQVIEREGLVNNAAAVGKQLLAGLRERVADMASVRQVRGLGLLAGIQLDSINRAAAVLAACQRDGILVRQQGAVITIAPPLILTASQATRIADTIEAAVDVAERS